jgi:hypothetical protein
MCSPLNFRFIIEFWNTLFSQLFYSFFRSKSRLKATFIIKFSVQVGAENSLPLLFQKIYDEPINL